MDRVISGASGYLDLNRVLECQYTAKKVQMLVALAGALLVVAVVVPVIDYTLKLVNCLWVLPPLLLCVTLLAVAFYRTTLKNKLFLVFVLGALYTHVYSLLYWGKHFVSAMSMPCFPLRTLEGVMKSSGLILFPLQFLAPSLSEQPAAKLSGIMWMAQFSLIFLASKAAFQGNTGEEAKVIAWSYVVQDIALLFLPGVMSCISRQPKEAMIGSIARLIVSEDQLESLKNRENLAGTFAQILENAKKAFAAAKREKCQKVLDFGLTCVPALQVLRDALPHKGLATVVVIVRLLGLSAVLFASAVHIGISLQGHAAITLWAKFRGCAWFLLFACVVSDAVRLWSRLPVEDREPDRFEFFTGWKFDWFERAERGVQDLFKDYVPWIAKAMVGGIGMNPATAVAATAVAATGFAWWRWRARSQGKLQIEDPAAGYTLLAGEEDVEAGGVPGGSAGSSRGIRAWLYSWIGPRSSAVKPEANPPAALEDAGGRGQDASAEGGGPDSAPVGESALGGAAGGDAGPSSSTPESRSSSTPPPQRPAAAKPESAPPGAPEETRGTGTDGADAAVGGGGWRLTSAMRRLTTGPPPAEGASAGAQSSGQEKEEENRGTGAPEETPGAGEVSSKAGRTSPAASADWVEVPGSASDVAAGAGGDAASGGAGWRLTNAVRRLTTGPTPAEGTNTGTPSSGQEKEEEHCGTVPDNVGSTEKGVASA